MHIIKALGTPRERSYSRPELLCCVFVLLILIYLFKLAGILLTTHHIRVGGPIAAPLVLNNGMHIALRILFSRFKIQDNFINPEGN